MFLTPDELADLTDRRAARLQVAWLRANRYPFEISASGRPKVLRSVVEARMGAVKRDTGRRTEPNFEALRDGQTT